LELFLHSVFRKAMKAWSWIALIILAILVKISSYFPSFIERDYSTGIYPIISRLLRILFGWIPWSMGDLIYAFFVILLIVKLFQLIRAVFQRRVGRQYLLNAVGQFLFFILAVYVCFYLLWGLNYSREGIASQLKLEQKEYTVNDLDTLILKLQARLNEYADRVDTSKRDSTLQRKLLFSKAAMAYDAAEKQFSFLRYRSHSIKASLYSPVAHLMGFSGYYNPFSGEAQIQTQYPTFLRPFIITHEIGHQLGYAKEDEASFSGFIACRAYDDVDFRYSMYFDLYLSASFEVASRDPKKFLALRDSLHPRVKRDYRALMHYLTQKQNFIEPFISKFYDSYLKANNQPLGKKTYDQVTYWLIGYYKRYGLEAL
jgi:hypothetical protein